MTTAPTAPNTTTNRRLKTLLYGTDDPQKATSTTILGIGNRFPLVRCQGVLHAPMPYKKQCMSIKCTDDWKT